MLLQVDVMCNSFQPFFLKQKTFTLFTNWNDRFRAECMVEIYAEHLSIDQLTKFWLADGLNDQRASFHSI